MPKIILLFLFVFFLFGNIYSNKNKTKQAELTFRTLLINFDTIAYNKPVTCFFKFKNTGNDDLKLYKASTNCGCVTVELDNKPIKKNSIGKIKVIYNAGTKGAFFKTIIIESNGKTPNQSLLIKGFVQ